jgi:DHA2 family multidrug resistance protein-like MFS transporter
VYRSEVEASLPAGIGPEVADAALDTLGGAVAIAQTLPGELAAALVAVAQAAFVDAIHFVALVSAIGAAATAIVAARALRTVPARADSTPADGALGEAIGATD